MKTSKPVTAPVPRKLRRLIEAKGLRGRIVLTNPDGAPVTPDEARAVANDVAMLDVLDARTSKALAAVAKAIPAAMVPALPSAPQKAATKRRAKR